MRAWACGRTCSSKKALFSSSLATSSFCWMNLQSTPLRWRTNGMCHQYTRNTRGREWFKKLRFQIIPKDKDACGGSTTLQAKVHDHSCVLRAIADKAQVLKLLGHMHQRTHLDPCWSLQNCTVWPRRSESSHFLFLPIELLNSSSRVPLWLLLLLYMCPPPPAAQMTRDIPSNREADSRFEHAM